MFNLTPLETVLVALWFLGIVTAIALVFLCSLDLRMRLLVLIAAVLLPVLGSLTVIIYAVFQLSRKHKQQQI